MSDRFDHSFEHKLESKPTSADGAAGGVRRLELITGTGRRRPWSTEDKALVLLESLEPGANVSAVARRHGMSPQQLFGWRRSARTWLDRSAARVGTTSSADGSSPAGVPAAGLKGGMSKTVGIRPTRDAPTQFAPVVLAAPSPSPVDTGAPPGLIEIVVGGAVVRVSGQVEERALAAVLSALRRAS